MPIISNLPRPIPEGAALPQGGVAGQVLTKTDIGTEWKSIDANAPKIENGTWWIYSPENGGYVDTGNPSQGEKGEDGKTPEKGVDYFTDAEKEEMVNAVLSNFTDVSEEGA